MSSADEETWEPYHDGRVCRRDPLGYVVVVPSPDRSRAEVPVSCPLCGFLMRSQMDRDAYLGFGCCDRCTVEHVTSKEDWDVGKRPTREEIERKVALRPRPTVILDV